MLAWFLIVKPITQCFLIILSKASVSDQKINILELLILIFKGMKEELLLVVFSFFQSAIFQTLQTMGYFRQKFHKSSPQGKIFMILYYIYLILSILEPYIKGIQHLDSLNQNPWDELQIQNLPELLSTHLEIRSQA